METIAKNIRRGAAVLLGNARRRALAAMMSLLLIGALGGAATWSVFTGKTDSVANQFQAGTVDITDNDNSAVMFNVTNMAPGQTETRCIQVKYTGTIAAKVSMYVSSLTVAPLNSKLNVTIRRGTQADPTFPTCGALGSPETLTTGATTLATFPTTFGTGLVGAKTSWAPNDVLVYEIAVALDPSAGDTEEGKSGGPVTFTWEAQSI